MTEWKLPPKAKIYEALSAVADERVLVEKPDGTDALRPAGAGEAAPEGAGPRVHDAAPPNESADAAGRMRAADGRARVVSSSGARTYTVTWTRRTEAQPGGPWPAGCAFSSNDNASYWQGYAGYPIIAVLLATGAIDYDPRLAARLAGVSWKEINDRYKRDYDKAVEAVLTDVQAAGGDRDAIAALADSIYERLRILKLERGRRGAPPPKANPHS